jgi:DNA-directed RNA polymerase subunit H (RpoH/RPB5)
MSWGRAPPRPPLHKRGAPHDWLMDATRVVHKCLTTLRDMLADRGDDVGSELDDARLQPVSRFFQSLLTVRTRDTVVCFCLDKDVLKEFVKGLKEYTAHELFEQHDGRRQFVVVCGETKPSPAVQEALRVRERAVLAVGGLFQVYAIKELLFNPSHHALVPRHERLTEAAVKQLLEAYQLKHRYQLPLILHTDVMARYLGLRHGDVVRIHRVSASCGECHAYRCCL